MYLEEVEARSKTREWVKERKSYVLSMYSLGRDYLGHLVPLESLKPFYRYFGGRSVTMVYEKACVLSGQSIQCQAYTDQEIADLRDQVRFKILY